jgi:hypothetical protein
MIQELSDRYRAERAGRARRTDWRLQITLWSLWTLVVAGTAGFQWYSDLAAQRPVNMLGLMIYTVLAGTIGLVVLTMAELWLEPQRFLD